MLKCHLSNAPCGPHFIAYKYLMVDWTLEMACSNVTTHASIASTFVALALPCQPCVLFL